MRLLAALNNLSICRFMNTTTGGHPDRRRGTDLPVFAFAGVRERRLDIVGLKDFLAAEASS
jgi:hypothetical protein